MAALLLCALLLLPASGTAGGRSGDGADAPAPPAGGTSLDGNWLFIPDSAHRGMAEQWFEPSYDRSHWRTIDVPGAWERLPGMATYDGWGWYARTVTLSAKGAKGNLLFKGVDDNAVVWVNGKMAGSHAGWREPFIIRAASLFHEGTNTIVVQVIDKGGNGGITQSVAIIAGAHPEEAVKGELSMKNALKSADWVRDAVVYSAYLRSASPEGTFAGLQQRIPELRRMGITVLWLLPIHPVGVKKRKGTLGSPYAVRDYYDVNPEFGTMVDFHNLVNAAHAAGMKVIIDLVINHTAWDSKLIAQHPEWFSRDSAGAIMSPNSNWTDVADLDYTKPGLRKYMADMMAWWVDDIGIDGFRCDVAEMVPLDFWEAARARLNRIRPVMMLAEGSMPEEHLKAFDATYAWNTYDLLGPLVKGEQPASALDGMLENESLRFPKGSLRLRFNTNHDKNIQDAPGVTRYGAEGLKLTAAVIATLPGIPLVYTGEEVANDKPLSLFEKAGVDWTRPRTMDSLYADLFALRRAHPALGHGDYLAIGGSEKVAAWLRSSGADNAVVLVNFSADSASAPVRFPETFPKKVRLREFRSGEEITGSRGAALSITLPPRSFRIFTTSR